MLKLEPRPQASGWWTYGSPLLALAVTVLIGVALFVALGKDPVRGLQVFFWEPIKTPYAVGELMVKATPLLLIALGLAVCFRSNVWNIGAEGQFVVTQHFKTDAGVEAIIEGLIGPLPTRRRVHQPGVLRLGAHQRTRYAATPGAAEIQLARTALQQVLGVDRFDVERIDRLRQTGVRVEYHFRRQLFYRAAMVTRQVVERGVLDPVFLIIHTAAHGPVGTGELQRVVQFHFQGMAIAQAVTRPR